MSRKKFSDKPEAIYSAVSWDDLSEVAIRKASRALGYSEDRLKTYTIDEVLWKLTGHRGDHYTLMEAMRHILGESEEVLQKNSTDTSER